MTREQCLTLELRTVKTVTAYLLQLYGMEEFRIDELFGYAHELAWANYIKEEEDNDQD